VTLGGASRILNAMGKRGSESVGKRLRELEKAERARAKREKRPEGAKSGPPVAGPEDLRGYGLPTPSDRRQPA